MFDLKKNLYTEFKKTGDQKKTVSKRSSVHLLTVFLIRRQMNLQVEIFSNRDFAVLIIYPTKVGGGPGEPGGPGALIPMVLITCGL